MRGLVFYKIAEGLCRAFMSSGNKGNKKVHFGWWDNALYQLDTFHDMEEGRKNMSYISCGKILHFIIMK